ncbi:hypothetical protein ACJX0J_017611, partial [Zea mays]
AYDTIIPYFFVGKEAGVVRMFAAVVNLLYIIAVYQFVAQHTGIYPFSGLVGKKTLGLRIIYFCCSIYMGLCAVALG